MTRGIEELLVEDILALDKKPSIVLLYIHYIVYDDTISFSSSSSTTQDQLHP